MVIYLAFRLTRHLYNRVCPVADVKNIFTLPVYKGEIIGKVNGQMKLVSTPNTGSATAVASPFGCIEYNFGIYYIPWSIAASYTSAPNVQPAVPASVTQFDSLMKKLILTFGSNANSQFYGGNPDASGDNLDLSKDKTEQDGAGSADNSDPIVQPDYPALGPTGVLRLHNAERMLMSMSRLDATVNVTSNAYTGDAKINDVVFSDKMDIDFNFNIGGPGYVIGCITRHNPVADLGYWFSYGVETHHASSAIAAGDRIRIQNALMNGDMLRIKEILKDRTTALSQYLRAGLFEGDVSTEPLTEADNPIVYGMWQDGSVFRKNDVIAAAKLMVEYSTPYTIVPDLM